jgi:hypothetical protein
MAGIDHLVIAVRDLAAASERYETLGFTLTPEARHPFGTGNRLVQLDRVFLELVTVIEPEKIPEHAPSRFSFGAFIRDYLEGGEGLSMLVLESRDARADRERFQAAGIHTYDPFDFARKARLPSGEEATVGFSLAFASHPEITDAGFFTCQQHAPQHFWKPEYQRHPNTATTVQDVWLVTRRPLDFAEFLREFAGVEDVVAADDRLEIETGRGTIVAATPERFEKAFGVPSPVHHNDPSFAGFAVGVADLGTARRFLENAGVRHVEGSGRLTLLPSEGFGAILAFSAAKAPL